MREEDFEQLRSMLAQGLDAKETQEEVNAHFRKRDVYDASALDKICPQAAYAHTLLIRSIQHLQGPRKFLDVGAGTGRLSARILEAFLEAHITLLDVSERQLDVAQEVLAANDGRFETVVGDMFDPKLQLARSTYDCVLSTFSICHGRSISRYHDLYRKIHDSLKPAGIFVCLDHVYGADLDLTMLAFQDWGGHLEQAFGEEAAPGMLLGAVIEDNPLPLFEHMSLLRQVGFRKADVLWKLSAFALYIGLR